MASSLPPLSLSFPVRLSKCSPLFVSLPTSVVCLSAQNTPSGYEREEVRWVREEQRWLREERRWVREEERWKREREALVREISDLQLRIQTLESRNSQQGISNMAALLQVLKEKGRFSESGSSATPMILEPVKKKRRTLKVGSQGEEVQAMQEALLQLGFYSGEEDVEFSSFSTGTASAVKTWQASLGLPEDGIMTPDLLHRLFTDQQDIEADKEAPNGAVTTSVPQLSEKDHSTIKDQSDTQLEVSQHRVFLLGENRWEDPSRLTAPLHKSKSTDTRTKCITCRGEGRLLCLECDGTGEPNIEPQFLEWVGEDTKCAYCEGLGYTVCDVCDGKTTG